ncbi:MAG: (2Fe-2S)-binding protein [Candidatus Muiribacterium halophilum]|uniref:(2Fe-2S)-binding protein n=1 Tax=Muiribacterium halophilum TaxID=2053465 RepID=A0A2N5ZDM5_MUIH1|nr:MAG: (2Fe-2S)-binding protein [Candidatus Muirbacterium halophilum]
MKIEFRLNGKDVSCDVPENYTLLRMIREVFGLTGTKKGCDQGECGACTVLMDKKAVTSCTVLAPVVNGKDIITIEGIEKDGKMHIIQEKMVEAGAVQCGFCTPGMVMSAYALFIQDKHFTREDIKKAIAGNLCRCTGYEFIIDGIEKALESRGK